ncbi:hypothetical protein Tcan_15901 [Toxocara canis]|uniref:Uncharacterized protein n=1 Tax=Toxocara canis TaxID=6265 RepID=A0A0B2VI21_TOXCA|nr:hypothetical protein Tcan_15901 [Toxocara canis]
MSERRYKFGLAFSNQRLLELTHQQSLTQGKFRSEVAPNEAAYNQQFTAKCKRSDASGLRKAAHRGGGVSGDDSIGIPRMTFAESGPTASP